MNKPLNLARVATLGALLAAGAAAQAQVGPYVGGSIAQPTWQDNVNGIAGRSSGTGLKVYGGWGFTPNWAVELGAADLGRLTNGTDTAKARGLYLDGVGKLPLNNDWSLLGRVGVANIKTTTTLGDDTGTALKVGAGVQYNLSKTVAVRGEWERYRLQAFSLHPQTDQVSVGVNVGF